MKIFSAVLLHETSRFSPIPTNLDSYRETYLHLPSTGEGSQWLDKMFDNETMAALNKNGEHEIVWGVLGSAQPSRPTSAADYAVLRTEFLTALERAMPVDMVVLVLHGAQVADGTDDCEGDILAAVRRLVGPKIPVGMVFDLHGNVSDAMVENTDVLLACLEYPHVDFDARAVQMAQLIDQAARGEIKPKVIRRRVPMLGTYYTTISPMREFVDWAKSFEGKDGILAVSITHGFAWSDIADCGANIVVCYDGERKVQAEGLAEQIADRYFALRDSIRADRVTAEEAVDRAMAHKGRPVLIADTTDNPGGGAAGDSTYLLRVLLDRGVKNAALGMLWDPVAAHLATSAGVGAQIKLRIGGKTGPLSGAPIDVEAKVLCCRDDAMQNSQGMMAPLGRSVAIEVEGVRIVINSVRQQVFDPVCFTHFGIDPRTCSIVVVKSQQHFYAMFGEFASKVIYSTPPGSVNADYRTIAFKNIPRPIYPIDRPPFEAFGKVWRN